MAVIRRHRHLLVLNAIVVLLSGGWFAWRLLVPPVVRATETSPTAAIEPAEYSRVQRLRVRIGLATRELVAMGCSQVAAENVLTRVLGWCRQNQAALDDAELAEQGARRQLSTAMSRVHVGPRDASLVARLPGLRDRLRDAAVARAQLDQLAVAFVASGMDPSVAQAWQAARATRGSAVGERMPAGPALGEARTSVGMVPPLGSVSGASLAGDGEIAPGMGGAVPANDQNLEGVLAAEQLVLPVPTQLAVPAPVAPTWAQ